MALILISACGLAARADEAAPANTPTGPQAAGTFITDLDRTENKDMGNGLMTPEELRKGLFPDDSETEVSRAARALCKEAEAAKFDCAAPGRTYTTYSLRGANFPVNSAELSEVLKRQLASFIAVFKGRQASTPLIHIDGHADTSGNEERNRLLSQRRAESVRNYLVSQGVSGGLFTVEGHGSKSLLNTAVPTAAENRRVEIARILQK